MCEEWCGICHDYGRPDTRNGGSTQYCESSFEPQILESENINFLKIIMHFY